MLAEFQEFDRFLDPRALPAPGGTAGNDWYLACPVAWTADTVEVKRAARR